MIIAIILIILILIGFFSLVLVSGSNDPGGVEYEKLLLTEYRRHDAIISMLNLEISGSYKGALITLTIYMRNYGDKSVDPVLYPFPRDHVAYQSIRNLKELSETDRERLIDKIILIINDFLVIRDTPGDIHEIHIIEERRIVNIKYGEFTLIINKDVYNFWRSRSRGVNSHITDIIMVIIGLRYHHYFNRTAIFPRGIYETLYKFGINTELSDPLNAGIGLYNEKTVLVCEHHCDINKLIGAIKLSELLNPGVINSENIKPRGLYVRIGVKKDAIPTELIETLSEISKKIPVVLFAAWGHDVEIKNTNKIEKTIPENKVLYENVYFGPYPVPFRYGFTSIAVYTPDNSDFPGDQLIQAVESAFTEASDMYEAASKPMQRKFNKELTRYSYVLKLQQAMEIKDPRGKYEWFNILERLLLSFANYCVNNPGEDKIFAVLPETHEIYEKFISELSDKRITNDPRGCLSKCKKIIEEFLNLPEPKYLKANRTKTRNLVKMYSEEPIKGACDDLECFDGAFDWFDPGVIIITGSGENNTSEPPGVTIEYNIDHTRYSALIHAYNQLGNVPGMYMPDPDILICILIVRYKCVMDRGQQWNIPYNWYKFLYDKFDLNVEGFGSPLNSQMLLLKLDNPGVLHERLTPNIAFCSLFRDTDEYFGSIGSLFKLDILKHVESRGLKHVSATINPPYVPKLLEDMCVLIRSWLEKCASRDIPCVIFTGLPNWYDAEFYIKFNENNPWIKEKRKLEKGDFYYQDASSGGLGRIYTPIGYTAYILDNYDKVSRPPVLPPGIYAQATDMLKYVAY